MAAAWKAVGWAEQEGVALPQALSWADARCRPLNHRSVCHAFFLCVPQGYEIQLADVADMDDVSWLVAAACFGGSMQREGQTHARASVAAAAATGRWQQRNLAFMGVWTVNQQHPDTPMHVH